MMSLHLKFFGLLTVTMLSSSTALSKPESSSRGGYIEAVAQEIIADIPSSDKNLIVGMPPKIANSRFLWSMGISIRNRTGLQMFRDAPSGLSVQCLELLGDVADEDFPDFCSEIVVEEVMALIHKDLPDGSRQFLWLQNSLLSSVDLSDIVPSFARSEVKSTDAIRLINSKFEARGIAFSVAFSNDVELADDEFSEDARSVNPILPYDLSPVTATDVVWAVVNATGLCPQFLPGSLMLSVNCEAPGNHWDWFGNE